DGSQALLPRRASHLAGVVRRVPRAAGRRSPERLRDGPLLRRRGDLAVARLEGAGLAGVARAAEGAPHGKLSANLSGERPQRRGDAKGWGLRYLARGARAPSRENRLI